MVSTRSSRAKTVALNPVTVASYPPADISVQHIADLLSYNLPDLIPNSRSAAKEVQPSIS